MKLYYFFIVFLSGYAYCNIVNRVRLIDHTSYAIEVISETVRRVEAREWCNLKMPDVTVHVDEVVMSWNAKGNVTYKNGFLTSIQQVDIQQSTVQQQVNLNTDRRAQAIVRGTLRMHDVAIGYDVVAELEDGTHHYTAIAVHPMISFAFAVTKIINTDEISVVVTGTIPTNRNLPRFMPNDKTSDVFTTLFDNSMMNAGFTAWGPDVFQPLFNDVVSTHPFPDICYNCAA